MKIAIVGGSGKMGSWAANFLAKEGHKVTIFGRDRQKLQGYQKPGIRISDRTETVSEADLVIISVPIDSFEAAARQYGEYIEAGQVVIEITSVKTAPMAALHKYLRTDKILGIHPMFGPGAGDLANHNFIITPTNQIENVLATRAREYLEAHDGRVSIMSPEEHDKTMAVVLGLPHILALISADTLLQLGSFEEMQKLGGTTCKLLLMLADSVLTEDPELYALIQTNVPGMTDLHQRVQKNLGEWTALVKANDKYGFIERMQALSEQRRKGDPDFVKAYDKMYRMLGSQVTPEA
jgi:prephenate dehydrogenase